MLRNYSWNQRGENVISLKKCRENWWKITHQKTKFWSFKKGCFYRKQVQVFLFFWFWSVSYFLGKSREIETCQSFSRKSVYWNQVWIYSFWQSCLKQIYSKIDSIIPFTFWLLLGILLSWEDLGTVSTFVVLSNILY